MKACANHFSADDFETESQDKRSRRLENFVCEVNIQRYLIAVEFFQFHTVLLPRLHMCVTSDAFWYPVTSYLVS